MSRSVGHAPAALAAAALLLLGACAPVIESMRLTPAQYDPRPKDYPVRIYIATAPRCPYEEVAVLSAEEVELMRHGLRSDDTAKRLRANVRRLGGDAIVGLSETIEDEGVTTKHTYSRTTSADSTSSKASTEVRTDVTPHRTRRLEGTVIRFTDDSCHD